MPQPAVAVSAYAAKGERWTDAQEAVGTFVAINGTDVTTEAGGVVRELAFEAGQPVKAGTVLVRLNTANELATLKSLQATAKLAAVQRDRWRALGKDKLVSEDEVEQRATNAASAQADADAQSALIAQKTIRAPFSGVLGLRRVNLGPVRQSGRSDRQPAVARSDLPRLLAARTAHRRRHRRHAHPRHGGRTARDRPSRARSPPSNPRSIPTRATSRRRRRSPIRNSTCARARSRTSISTPALRRRWS